MKKIAIALFGVAALVASTFGTPAGFLPSQPAKPSMTALILPTCPPTDPNGCGILD